MSSPLAVGKAQNPVQQAALAAGIDLASLPRHIGMIMDGNGRFAKKQGLARLWGHRQGYKALRTALLDASDLGIEVLTVYAFSSENWARPDDEVAGLMSLIERSTREEIGTMMKNNVQMRIAGRLHELPASLREAFEWAVETTKNNTGIKFCLAVNYGGRAEIVDAVKQLMQEGISADQVDEDSISARLYQPDLPNPDMILRTAGEMRWSNFLLYQAAYAELVVTQTTWPEFSQPDLFAAVQEFQRRQRKFGKVVPG